MVLTNISVCRQNLHINSVSVQCASRSQYDESYDGFN